MLRSPGDPSGGVVYLRIVLSPEGSSRLWVFLNFSFHREGLLAPRPTPKLEDYPFVGFPRLLFNIFADTLHIGGRSSIRNLRTRHAVVTGTHWHTTHNSLLLICITIWRYTVSAVESVVKHTYIHIYIHTCICRCDLPLWPHFTPFSNHSM